MKKHMIPRGRQKAAASGLGCSYQHLNDVLNHRAAPSVTLAKKIEAEFGIPWTSFFQGDPTTKSTPAPTPGSEKAA